VIQVTSEPRLERVGKEGVREDYVVDAVFPGRNGEPAQPTRYPVRVSFLDPVAYAQDLKKGDAISWKQKNDPPYYVPVTVDGPRNDETGTVPVLWHHDRESRDGTKPAGDSHHDVPNRFLYRPEVAQIVRATQNAMSARTASAPSRNNAPAAPRSDVSYATKEEMEEAVGGVGFDMRIVAKAVLGAVDHSKLDPQTVKHLSLIAEGGKRTA
jgi:hypothetical protein